MWGEIEPEVCQKLIESMPRRIAAVIKALEGGSHQILRLSLLSF